MSDLEWIVTEVVPAEDYKLLITFKDGSRRVFDFLPMLDDEINAPLKDKSLFMKARVIHHTVG